MVIIAMNSNVQHHIAKGREPNLKLWGITSIRQTEAQRGGKIVSQALEMKNELTINEVHKSLSKAKLKDGTIMGVFKKDKGKKVLHSQWNNPPIWNLSQKITS